jgi:hypothetical protein
MDEASFLSRREALVALNIWSASSRSPRAFGTVSSSKEATSWPPSCSTITKDSVDRLFDCTSWERTI